MREPSRRSHFIGSFVTMPLDAAADQSVSRFRLIDGQQRLTTLVLLLAALRDIATERGETDLAEDIQEAYLSNPRKKNELAKKLLVTEPDQPDLDRVLGRPANPVGRAGDAYKFFADRLRLLAPGTLSDARHAAMGRLTVVSITLEGDDDPHLIFESLNAKGERLTQSDLLRNYFLMRLPQAEADAEFARIWQPMQADLGDDLTQFFRHYLMRNAEGGNVRRDEIYFEVKERVDRDAPTPPQVVRALAMIRRFASYYARLVSPAQFELDTDAAERVARLHQLKVTTAYPLLMNVLDAIADGRLTSEAYIALLDLLESFLVRRLVCGVPTNQLRKIFLGLCRVAAEATDVSSFLVAIRLGLSQNQRCPTDAAFRDALIRRVLYMSATRDTVRYVLNRIELSFGHKEAPNPAADGVQVEHVLPQTLTEDWKNELSPTDPEGAKAIHDQWVHTLGNLTLTGYNSTLSNDSFATKRAIYIDSKFTLNDYFASVARWDAAAIEARGVWLADHAMKVWPDIADGRAEASATKRQKSIKTPISCVTVGKTRIPVSSMIDAVHQVYVALHQRDAVKFDLAIASAIPKKRCGTTDVGMRSPRSVGTIFIDLHGSAGGLREQCQRLVRAMGLPDTDIVFEP